MQYKAYLQLIRAPAVFSAISNILAAQMIITGGQPQWPVLLMLMAISACLYAGGMVLNDCLDIEQDQKERPDRPLPSRLVSVRVAWSMVGALFLTAGILALQLGQTTFLIVLLLMVTIIMYDKFTKDTVTGSLVMGLCRYLNWILGFSSYDIDLQMLLIPIPVFIYVASLTELSRFETAAGNRVNIFSAIAGLCGAAILILVYVLTGVFDSYWTIPVLAILAYPLIVRFVGLYRNWSASEVQKTVGLMIYFIIPLDALIVTGAGLWWAGILILLLVIPARLTGRYLYVT